MRMWSGFGLVDSTGRCNTSDGEVPNGTAAKSGLAVYIADPHGPGQGGTNENTNGVLRQYILKGSDLARWNVEEIEAVTSTLNAIPRKALGWKTPEVALNEHQLLVQQVGATTTD
jgi:IS30 family transposase